MKPDGKKLDEKAATLTEADISSQRVSRRSLLATLGIGAGVAAGAVVGATPAHARESDLPDFGRSCAFCSDQDGPGDYHNDPDGYGRCARRRGCRDND